MNTSKLAQGVKKPNYVTQVGEEKNKKKNVDQTDRQTAGAVQRGPVQGCQPAS